MLILLYNHPTPLQCLHIKTLPFTKHPCWALWQRSAPASQLRCSGNLYLFIGVVFGGLVVIYIIHKIPNSHPYQQLFWCSYCSLKDPAQSVLYRKVQKVQKIQKALLHHFLLKKQHSCTHASADMLLNIIQEFEMLNLNYANCSE